MRIRVTLEVEYEITDVSNREEQAAIWARHCETVKQFSRFNTPGLVEGSAAAALIKVVEVED